MNHRKNRRKGNAERFLSIMLAAVLTLSLMPENVMAFAAYAQESATEESVGEDATKKSVEKSAAEEPVGEDTTEEPVEESAEKEPEEESVTEESGGEGSTGEPSEEGFGEKPTDGEVTKKPSEEDAEEESREESEEKESEGKDTEQEKIPEEEGLCPHHAQHTEGCGYGETTPCGYKCRICPVQELMDALPDAEEITVGNAADVEEQLAKIDRAKEELTDEELDALDITRYMAAVEALFALEGQKGENSPKTLEETGAYTFEITFINIPSDVTVIKYKIPLWDTERSLIPENGRCTGTFTSDQTTQMIIASTDNDNINIDDGDLRAVGRWTYDFAKEWERWSHDHTGESPVRCENWGYAHYCEYPCGANVEEPHRYDADGHCICGAKQTVYTVYVLNPSGGHDMTCCHEGQDVVCAKPTEYFEVVKFFLPKEFEGEIYFQGQDGSRYPEKGSLTMNAQGDWMYNLETGDFKQHSADEHLDTGSGACAVCGITQTQRTYNIYAVVPEDWTDVRFYGYGQNLDGIWPDPDAATVSAVMTKNGSRWACTITSNYKFLTAGFAHAGETAPRIVPVEARELKDTNTWIFYYEDSIFNFIDHDNGHYCVDGICVACGQNIPPVAEVNGKTFFELKDAWSAARKAYYEGAGDPVTVTLLGDANLENDSFLELADGQKVILEGGGHTITCCTTWSVPVRVRNAELTANHVTFDNQAMLTTVLLEQDGQFTMNGGAIQSNGPCVYMEGGRFTMNGGGLTINGSSYQAEHALCVTGTGAVVEIKDGSLQGADCAVYVESADANVTIFGGSFTGTSGGLNVATSSAEVKLSGGTFSSVQVPEGSSVKALLAAGCNYVPTGNEGIDTTGALVTNVRVEKEPITITAQPEGKTVYYGSEDTIRIIVDTSGQPSYQWYEIKDGATDGSAVDGATGSELPLAQFDVGIHQFFCRVSLDGCSVDSERATVTVNQSGAMLTVTSGKTEYAYGETITVTAKSTPTGAAPAFLPAAGSRLRGEPGAGQMALFYNGSQISTAENADTDGVYCMTVSVKALIDAGADYGPVSITAKFAETASMAGAEGTVDVILKPATLTISGATLDVKTYDGTKTANVAGVTFDGFVAGESLTLGTGYTATAEFADENAGTGKNATVTVTLQNENYSLEKNTFTITNAEIGQKSVTPIVTLEKGSYGYTGEAIIPAADTVKVTYTEDKDTIVIPDSEYLVTYTNNTNIGRATVTVSDAKQNGGNYKFTDNATTTFEITAAGINKAEVTVKGDYIYNGKDQTPNGNNVTVTLNGKTLKEGTDYALSYHSNVKAGTATVTVTGTGNYEGTAAGTFTIARASLTITAKDQTITYGGSIAQGTGQVDVSGKLASGDTLESVALTASSSEVEAENKTITPSAATIKNGGTDMAANYDITYAAGQLTIEYFKEKITVTLNDKELTEALWFSPAEEVTIKADGFAIAAVAAGGARPAADEIKEGSIKIPHAEDVAGKTFYFKQNDTGYMTDGIRYTLKLDDTPPGGSIELKYKFWDKFLSVISFGHYKATGKTVAIKADDNNGSGIKAIEYVIVTGGTSYATEGELETAGLKWTNYSSGKPTVDDNTQSVIYARLTDNVGNVTYLSSEGIFLDTEAPAISGFNTVTGSVKNVQAQVSITVDETAAVYLVAVPKAEADKITVEAKDVIATCDVNAIGAADGAPIADAIVAWKGTLAAGGENLTGTKDITGLAPNKQYTVYAVAVDKVIDMDQTTDYKEPVYTGNVSGVSRTTFTTTKSLPVIGEPPVLSGTYGQTIGEMKLTGTAEDKNGAALAGTWTVSAADRDKIPSAGKTEEAAVTFTPDDEGFDTIAVTASLEVSPRSLSAADVTITQVQGTYTYTGAECKPPVALGTGTPAAGIWISDSGAVLTADDFTVSYGNNKNAGTATVMITGQGNYTGSVTREFTIGKADVTLTFADQDITYGETPVAATADPAAAITYSYTADGGPVDGLPENAGTYAVTATVAATDNYNGATKEITLTINAKTVSNPTIILSESSFEYDGNAKEPAVTVKDGETVIPPEEYTVGYSGNTSVGTAAVTITDKDGGNYTVSGSANFTITKAEQAGLTITGLPENVAYGDRFTLEAEGGLGEGAVTWAVESGHATVDGSGKVTITGTGKITVTVTKAGDNNYGAAAAECSFTANPKTITISGAEIAEKVYDKTASVTVTDITFDGLMGGDSLILNADYTAKAVFDSADAGTGKAVTVTVTLGGPVANYTLAENTFKLENQTVEKAEQTLSVPASAYEKTYGDGAFSLACSTNGDGTISYVSGNEGVLQVAADGTATIKKAGTATVTVSLSAGKNYKAAENRTITVTVNKKKAANPDTITKSYTDTAGSGGTVAIDVAGLLPSDKGAASYRLLPGYADYVTSAAVDQEGRLTFMVGTDGRVGDTTDLVVTAKTDNYEEITVTVHITLTDKLILAQKEGHEVAVSGSGTLVYGQKLSSLALNTEDAVFVEKGTDKAVTGILAWTDGAAMPDVGTTTAEWTFTPDNTDLYVTITGTAAIRVIQAEGTVANKEGADGYQTAYTFTGAEIKEPASANFTTNSGSTDFTYTWYKGPVAEENKLAEGTRPSAVGSYTLKVDAAGTANYTAATTNLNVTVGTFTADAVATLAAANEGTDGWYHGDVTVMAPGGYTIAATQAGSYGGSLTVDADWNGAYTYYLKQDTTGYITEAMAITVKRDTVQPTAKIAVKEKWWQSFLEAISLGLYTNTEDTVTIEAEDTAGTANSGIGTVEYYISGTAYVGKAGLAGLEALEDSVWNPYNSGSRPKVSQNTVNYIYARVADKAGNVSYVSTEGIVYDTTVPTLTLAPEGTAYIDAGQTENTYTGTVQVAITAVDAAVTGQDTLDTVKYVLDNGAETAITAGSRLQIAGQGSHSLSVTATDKAGNRNTQTLTVRIYGEAPAVTLTPASHIVYDGAAIAEGTDFTLDKGGSAGTVAYYYKGREAGDDTYVPGLPANAGSYTIKAVVAEDSTGFYPQGETTTGLTIEQVQPTITLSAGVNREDGIAIGLTATVATAGNRTVPTGEVIFYDTTTGSDVLIAAVPLTSGTAAYSYAGLSPQVYKLKAVYAGDTNHKTAASAEQSVDTEKKNQAALSFPAISAKTYGDAAFNLSVTGGSGTGAVAYTSSDPDILSISGATATIRKAGTVTITAIKAADSDYNQAAAQTSVTIGKKALTIRADDKLNVVKGSRMPAFTYTQNGLVNGDTITTAPTMTTSAKDTDTAGTYEISIGGAAISNPDGYAVTYQAGTLTIVEQVYAVTVTNGTAAVNGVAVSTASEGQVITVTANSRPGYTFKYWSSSAGGTFADEKAAATTFTMPASAVTLTANYTKGGSGGGNGSGNESGGNGGNGSGNESSGDGGNGQGNESSGDGGNSQGNESSGDSGQGIGGSNGGDTAPAAPVGSPAANTNPGMGAIQAKPGITKAAPGTTKAASGRGTTSANLGTGNTAKPGSGAEPGNSSSQGTGTDTEKPFIKGEDGKTGWDVIRAEEEKTEDGNTINVDMNGATVVPGNIFDSIKGRDVTITFDMGDGIVWSVDGKGITRDTSRNASRGQAGDIDFSVKTGVSAIPVEIVNNVTGGGHSIQLSLAHEGEFGFTAVLSINLGRENAGYTASLYHYNENTEELEFVCRDTVTEDGTAFLAFTHASDYVIAIDKGESAATEPAQPENPDEGSITTAEKTPETTQAWRPWWTVVAGILVIVVGIVLFFVVKRKRGEE